MKKICAILQRCRNEEINEEIERRKFLIAQLEFSHIPEKYESTSYFYPFNELEDVAVKV